MAFSMFGTKLGMTRVFSENGASTPVTVIEVGPCVVTQVREVDKDGYAAVQIGFGELKPRNATFQIMGHDAKAGTGPKRHHAEFKVPADKMAEFTLGQTLTAAAFKDQRYVDVTGTSKGKGFAGVMKRHGFKGMSASHGTERKHRSPGSIGGHASNRGFGGGLKKGKRMPGHMGAERVTARSLDVVSLDPEKGIILVKGPVPGPNNGLVIVRNAVRLSRSKIKRTADAEAKKK
jgi:large subunit ribosomal protein L3